MSAPMHALRCRANVESPRRPTPTSQMASILRQRSQLLSQPLRFSPRLQVANANPSFFARQCWLHNSRVQRQTWAGTDSAASQRSLLSVKHALSCWSTSSQEQVPMQATCVTSTGVILSLSLEHWASGRSCRYCTARRCTGLGWAGLGEPSLPRPCFCA